MAEYKIDPEPDTDRVWLLDSKRYGPGPLLAERVSCGGWAVNVSDDGDADAFREDDGRPWFQWRDLLALGTVSDVDPDDVSWLPPGPWTTHGLGIVDADDQGILMVDTANVEVEDEYRLAALIARLVNEHVARHTEQGGGA